MTVSIARLSCFTSVAVLACATTLPAQAQVKSFDVPAQGASAGIAALGRQANIQIAASRRATAGKRTNMVRGAMTVGQALDRLLNGTGLSARNIGPSTWAILPDPNEAVRPAPTRVAATVAVPMLTQDTATEDAGEETATSDIVITGSRIRRAGIDTLEPATTVSSEYLEARGITNVADALRASPSFAQGQSSSGHQPGLSAGMNFIDRFGLGSNRTLTVVNGRRFVSTNAPSIQGNVGATRPPAPAGMQVDLNVIPTLMVDRVENLAIGGAPTYGSDAIAGVVNVILKKEYEGFEVSALSGISSRGDNARLNLSAIAGKSFFGDRLNIMGAVTYDRSDGLTGLDRERVASNYFFLVNPLATSGAARTPSGRTTANDGRVNPNVPFNTGNTDGIPNSVLVKGYHTGGIPEAGVLLPVGSYIGADGLPVGFGANRDVRLIFNEAGNLVPYDAGIPYANGGNVGGMGMDWAKSQMILADVERLSANLNASFAISDATELFVESSYYRGTGQETTDQPVYNSAAFGGTTNARGPLTYSVYDARINQASRDQLLALGVTRFQVSQHRFDLGSDRARSLNQVYRGVLGISSRINLGGKTLDFDAAFSRGRTDGQYSSQSLIQQNFVNAMNVKLDANNKLVCDPNPAFNVAPGPVAPVADPNCIPLNLLGMGKVTPEALAYVSTITTARGRMDQTNAVVTLGTGNLMNPWGAGPIGVLIGAEYRREEASLTPDLLQRTGALRNGPIAAVSGSFETREAFGELTLPLIGPANDIPLIDTLEATGKVRYVDNSVNGGFTTFTAGGRYRPVSDIEFRGNFTRSLRAPSIVELSMPRSTTQLQFPDPCDPRNIGQGTSPTVRARNCAAFFTAYGIDGATFTSSAVTNAVPVLQGGNPNLANEVADSYTFGVVLRPSFLPRFQMAVDWNRIRITGNIATLTPADIAQGCYDNPNFDASNPDAGNAFCTQIHRERGGARNGQIMSDPLIPGVDTAFVNGAYIHFQGLTAVASYRNIALDWTGVSDLRLSLDGAFYYLDKLCFSNNAVTETCSQGTIGNETYSTRINATFASGPARLNVEWDYKSGALYDRTFTVEARDVLKVSSLSTFNLGMAIDIAEKTTMGLAVTNLTDKMPPFPSTIGDLIGRRFAMTMSHRF